MRATVIPSPTTVRPLFGRLRARGLDPVVGLSRQVLRNLDESGAVPFIRLRSNGGLGRPVVLIDYERLTAYLRAQSTPTPPQS